MKITLRNALMLQQGVKSLMKDGDLNIKCKLDLVTLGEAVDLLVKPFMAIRSDVVTKYTTKDEEGNPVMDKAAIEKELLAVIEEEKDLSIEEFTLVTSADDKFVTGETLFVFKQIFGDKFVLNTD